MSVNRRAVTVASATVNAEPPLQRRNTTLPTLHIFQSRVMRSGKPWLVRIVVDVDRNPPEIVTVYRTSNVRRYWRDAS